MQAGCSSRYEEFRNHEGWKIVEIGYEKCEVASLDMDDFVEGKSYRLVVQRSPLKDKDGSRLRNLSPDPFQGVLQETRLHIR